MAGVPNLFEEHFEPALFGNGEGSPARPRKKAPVLGKLAPKASPPTVSRPVDPFGRTSDDPDYDPFEDGAATVPVPRQPRDLSLPAADEARRGFTQPAKEYKGPRVKKDGEQYARTIKYLQARWPGWYTKSEHNESTMRWQKDHRGKWLIEAGPSIKRDLGGFADIVGVSSGRFVACQITTRGQVVAHLCDYTSDQKSGGLGDVTTHENLRAFLTHGGLFVILGYYKLGRLWECDEFIVTIADLDAAVKRKTGPRKRG